jgi:hypothetical protein
MEAGVLKWHLTKDIVDMKRSKRRSLVPNCIKVTFRKDPLGQNNSTGSKKLKIHMLFTNFRTSELLSNFFHSLRNQIQQCHLKEAEEAMPQKSIKDGRFVAGFDSGESH